MFLKLKFPVLLLLVILMMMGSCKENGETKEVVKQQEVETPEAQVDPGLTEDETVYKIAAEMPRFPGCEDEEKTIEKYLCANKRLNNYISNRLRYPKIALNNRVEGTVTAKFVVRQDGLIDDIRVENDIGYGCGKTVLAIIQSMNRMDERWIPGKNGGVPVRVEMSLPVEFRLMIDEDKR